MNYHFLLRNSYQISLLQEQLQILIEITNNAQIHRSELSHIDGIHLLKNCQFNQPYLSLKIKSSNDLYKKYNFVIVQLTSVVKKYDQPYNLGYESANKPDLDLSKLYKFRFFRPTINSDFNKKIVLVRGGAFSELLGVLVFVWFMNWLDSMRLTQAFQSIKPPNHEILGSQSNSKPQSPGVCGSSQSGFYIQSKTSSTLHMEKPSNMPHQEYVSLTKEEKRNLPDKRDGFITVEGHPNLVARFGQVEFKTPDHGGVHDLPTNEKGKTPKTEENALALRDSLIDMPNRKNIHWFDNGMYQGGTDRGYDSVNIYDSDKRVIAVYKKQEDGKWSQFSTTCEVTAKEEAHLFKSNGNFVTEAVLNDQKALTIIKNLNNNEK